MEMMDNVKKRASIVIPTYNRAAYLKICLQALSELATNPSEYEIIVVDNNSPDHTRQITQDFIAAHPYMCVKYELEKNQGANFARNTGVRLSTGNVVCFLDDDSPPAQDWLNLILEGFKDDKAGCIGGPAILDYQGQPIPPWLRGDLQGLLSGYSLPLNQPTELSSWSQYPFSCNLGIRRSVFDALGDFRTDLGRSGGNSFAADETELIDRIHRAGWKVIYHPTACVRHLVTPERLKKTYIYKVGLGLAMTHVYLTYSKQFLPVSRWFLSDLLYASRQFIKFLYAFLARKPLWFDDYMKYWMVAQRLPIRVKSVFTGNPPNGK